MNELGGTFILAIFLIFKKILRLIHKKDDSSFLCPIDGASTGRAKILVATGGTDVRATFAFSQPQRPSASDSAQHDNTPIATILPIPLSPSSAARP